MLYIGTKKVVAQEAVYKKVKDAVTKEVLDIELNGKTVTLFKGGIKIFHNGINATITQEVMLGLLSKKLNGGMTNVTEKLKIKYHLSKDVDYFGLIIPKTAKVIQTMWTYDNSVTIAVGSLNFSMYIPHLGDALVKAKEVVGYEILGYTVRFRKDCVAIGCNTIKYKEIKKLYNFWAEKYNHKTI